MADRRSQQVSERETLVHGHRQTPGDAEGLQGAEGRRRGSDPGVRLRCENKSPRSTHAHAAPSPRRAEGGGRAPPRGVRRSGKTNPPDPPPARPPPPRGGGGGGGGGL